MPDVVNTDHPKKSRTRRQLWWCAMGALVFVAVAVASIGKKSVRPGIDPELSAARHVLLALTLYAADEPSAKVETLDDLLEKEYLEDASLIYRTPPDCTKRERWVFLGYDPSQPGGTPVLISAEPHDGKRAVGTNDTGVELMTESSFQTWARKQEIQIDAASSARK